MQFLTIKTIGRDKYPIVTQDVLAKRPPASGFGGLYYAPDVPAMYYDMGTWVQIGGGSGPAVTDDNTTNATEFPVWSASNSGSLSPVVSSTKLKWNPSLGTLFSNIFDGSAITLEAANPGFTIYETAGQLKIDDNTSVANRLHMDENGNVGLSCDPNVSGAYDPVASEILSLEGRTDYGVVELATAAADGADSTAGDLVFVVPTNVGGGHDQRIAYIQAVTPLAGTANDRGGLLNFWTKQDAFDIVLRMQLDDKGNIINSSGSILTSATDGFMYFSSCNGVPIGTPTSYSGLIPTVVDRQHGRFYGYVGGAWVNFGGGGGGGGVLQGQFLTSGTSFTVPTSVTLLWLTLQAGGASGSGGSSGPANPGGGSGELMYRRPYVVTGGAALAYAIGAGGAGTTGVGNAGGDTTFDTGALVVTGGKTATAGPLGGNGGGPFGAVGTGSAGTAGTRDVDVRGGSSGGGAATTAGGPCDHYSGGAGGTNGGGGGASHFGSGGVGAAAASDGGAAPATSYGAAGGGTNAFGHLGGNGTGGCILIEWIA